MSNAHVLVIDDQVLLRHAITALLEGDGYEVTAVENGAKALEAARRSRPDAATINLNLPDTDGVTLAGELRAIPGLEAAPFILITSEELPGNCDVPPAPHVTSYVHKNDLIDRLLPCLESHLGGR